MCVVTTETNIHPDNLTTDHCSDDDSMTMFSLEYGLLGLDTATKVATLQEGDEDADLEDVWGACTDRVGVKSISTNDAGQISLSWQSNGDDGCGLLDDIWETKMPSSTTKGNSRKANALRDEEDDDTQETSSRRPKTSSAMSSNGEPPAKRSRVATGQSSASKQASAATLIRMLNGCDSLLLEGNQILQMFGSDETLLSVQPIAIVKLTDKFESKLTSSMVETLTQGWQQGHAENRGCELVGKMRTMLSHLSLAGVLSQCLHAKPGMKDIGGDGMCWGYTSFRFLIGFRVLVWGVLASISGPSLF